MTTSTERAAFGLILLTAVCWADVYMHNPRGSNDRNCERNVNRNNGNRLFDRYLIFSHLFLKVVWQILKFSLL